MPPAHNLAINPDLPPDQPLEPGSGPPKFHASQAARIAASEAALGRGPGGASSAGGKSGFIAAARRAANAAMQTAGERVASAPPTDVLELEDLDAPSLRGKMMKRVKSLFIAASVVAIVVGSIQIGSNFLLSNKIDSVKTAATTTDDTTASTEATAPDETAPASPALNPLAPAKLPGKMTDMTPLTAASTNPNAVPLDFGASAPPAPSLLSPPVLNSQPTAPAPKDDVTGSIPALAIARPPVNLPTTAPTGDRLPIAIGGSKLRSAAIAGDGAAAYEIAIRFAEGRGVTVSQEDAARWFEKAAGKGIAPAQFRYASLLEKGQGVKKDLVAARRLYLAAAGKGNGKAMHNLAVLYAEGVEGKPDYASAAQWFRKAAQRGIADSQYNLGVLCARGLGTERNVAESYQWFALAAAQGDKESAKKRDEIAAHMDAEQLDAAQRAVQTFAIEPQPSEATAVPEPAGGWDGVSAAPVGKPRQMGPLSLTSFENRKR
jgi:localization factor PodJL